ncbi:hypothetical protein Enr13x_45650 [Stieleria neptunia]|uniref:Secreted protein n=1 Tax=Stieleria neptunia TaxID=2527979 RepID=A0A518HV63_9BACT|nr:hypothetical protein [Stieleria neptunia]QDV44697.1 hypothetical protein Enr13x_45650 [Stieleria neptunia]
MKSIQAWGTLLGLLVCLSLVGGCGQPDAAPDAGELSDYLADNPEIANAEPPEIETE